MSEYISIYRVLHEIIYFSLCFSVVDYSVIFSLIICPRWLQQCHGESDKEIAVLIVVPGAFSHVVMSLCVNTKP